jgi:hypothetical protein
MQKNSSPESSGEGCGRCFIERWICGYRWFCNFHIPIALRVTPAMDAEDTKAMLEVITPLVSAAAASTIIHPTVKYSR